MKNWIVLRRNTIMVNGTSESLSQENHLKALDGFSIHKWRHGIELWVEEGRSEGERIAIFPCLEVLCKEEGLDLSFVTLRIKIGSSGRSQFTRR